MFFLKGFITEFYKMSLLNTSGHVETKNWRQDVTVTLTSYSTAKSIFLVHEYASFWSQVLFKWLTYILASQNKM